MLPNASTSARSFDCCVGTGCAHRWLHDTLECCGPGSGAEPAEAIRGQHVATVPGSRVRSKLFGSTFISGSRDADRAAATDVVLVRMKQVATRTAERSDIALTAKQVRQAVVVEPDGRSDVVLLARNPAIGLFLGALLGIGLSFLCNQLDRRLRSVESLAEAFGRSVLARIPLTDTFRGGLPPSRSIAEEAFSALWTNLRYFNVTRGIDSVLVTSATSGDGKSTVALNLAAAALRNGSRVVLIETDLRRPSRGCLLMASPAPGGLTQILRGVMPFEQALVRLPARPASGQTGKPERDPRHVRRPDSANPAEMLDSTR